MSLNTIEFCQKYLYWWLTASDPNEPVLTLSNFMFIWSTFQLVTTVYILLFIREETSHKPRQVKEKEQKENEEVEPNLKQTVAIFKDMLTNHNTLIWFSFAALC